MNISFLNILSIILNLVAISMIVKSTFSLRRSLKNFTSPNATVPWRVRKRQEIRIIREVIQTQGYLSKKSIFYVSRLKIYDRVAVNGKVISIGIGKITHRWDSLLWIVEVYGDEFENEMRIVAEKITQQLGQPAGVPVSVSYDIASSYPFGIRARIARFQKHRTRPLPIDEQLSYDALVALEKCIEYRAGKSLYGPEAESIWRHYGKLKALALSNGFDAEKRSALKMALKKAVDLAL